MADDPRCHPLIELSRQHIHSMLQPVLCDAELGEVARVEGGLTNTIYRITTNSAVYALRVYAAGSSTFRKESRLLSTLAATIPVPDVLYADASGRRCVHPYLVYPWIEGISLNECRRQTSERALLALAEPLGAVLARISHTTLPSGDAMKTVYLTSELERAEGQLRTGLARGRLGSALADGLRDCLDKSASVFSALERPSALIHGDCGGRNILVNAKENGEWGISGVIDWEEAASGSALWDVGSLFRYPRRYSKEFRRLFASGYRSAGGELPDDWWLIARRIDVMRLVGVLSEERELPGVFAECVELVQSVVAVC
jgi:aminoglycoside phosphotransferase (APT) family kinase protein